ncbi:MAG TPA: hypothetical protein V6D28_10980 [Leptolyngbyaceae cyanobacterium]
MSARIFKYANCGVKLDRDLNASLNLECWHPDINYPKLLALQALPVENHTNLTALLLMILQDRKRTLI